MQQDDELSSYRSRGAPVKVPQGALNLGLPNVRVAFKGRFRSLKRSLGGCMGSFRFQDPLRGR